ncbi:MAG: MBL fold metallo-hydrolase [Proteobacteria bacterium]|nr:MBL fold metallo-hydrolase [Pseudomonadota bacterium]
MVRLELDGWTALSLNDVSPAPAAWSHAFPDNVPEHDDPAMARYAPDGVFRTRFTVVALRRGDGVALIDAGLGPGPSAYFGGLQGGLDHALEAHGIARAAVTCMAFTHFHLDHVGWASVDGEACFPNAVYAAPAIELAHWAKAGAAAAKAHHVDAFERHVAPLLAQGRIAAIQDGGSPAGWPELKFRAAYGHTPGHSAVVLAARRPLVVVGDSWHSPVQIEHPEWCHRADADKEASIRSRRALADWAAATDAIVAAGHFPPGLEFGRIVAAADGAHRFHALDEKI